MKKISLILIALFMVGCATNKVIIKSDELEFEVISVESIKTHYEVWYDKLQIEEELFNYGGYDIEDFNECPERFLNLKEIEEKYSTLEKAKERYNELKKYEYVYDLEINKITENSKTEKVEVTNKKSD